MDTQVVMDNWGLITTVVVPVVVAPIITAGVNKFGSERTKSLWDKVRRIYRLGVGMEKPK